MSNLIFTDSVKRELAAWINRHNLEAACGNTPDYILADYLCKCLSSLGDTIFAREAWRGGDDHDSR